MRVLIAYDGSEGARAAVTDLRRAGLPRETEALVVAVAGSFPTPSPPTGGLIAQAATSRGVSTAVGRARETEAAAPDVAREMALDARRLVKMEFPAWAVNAEGLSGAPAQEVVRKADEWRADLIVLGSRGRTAPGRLAPGSVSKKVAVEANCSVRVARGGSLNNGAPARIIVSKDGTSQAEMSCRAVAARSWPPGSVVRLVTAFRPFGMYGLTPDEQGWRAEGVQRAAEEILRGAGLHVISVMKKGDAKGVLLDEARSWGAHCVFVGPRVPTGAPERHMLDSVSSAILDDAPCSVELVRA